MSINNSVRVRFAPSPTGFLHVGGARTALFNYFFAKRHKGVFILRVEDTDLERSKKEYEDEIINSMAWLGLKSDEGPFYQTKRFDLYRAWAMKLLQTGHAYKCFCTPQELELMRAEATARGDKPMYDRRWRDRPESEHPADKPWVLRFKTPLDGGTVVEDLIKGSVTFENKEIDDFIILRSSTDGLGAPTYNFTVVVDDLDMKISHVIRGDDHLSNTPKQILMMRALGGNIPKFAHVPMILGPDKTKLSKRHGATAVTQYRDKGYLPQALVNGLIRLGWSHGDQEFFTYDDLARVFDLADCGDSASVFDVAKLDHLNAQHMKAASKDSILALIDNQALRNLLSGQQGDELYKAALNRAVRLTDLETQLGWALKDPIDIDQKLQTEVLNPTLSNPNARKNLSELVTKLADCCDRSDVSAAMLALEIKVFVELKQIKMPEVGKPMRVMLTGGLGGPDLGLIVMTLGKTRLMDRCCRAGLS